MGKKINPLGFRLGTTQGHHSLWFAQPKNYSEGLQEDQKIRDCIKNYVRDCIKKYEKYVQKNKIKSSGIKSSVLEVISRIEIKKSIDLIEVIIYMGSTKSLVKSRRIKELQMSVQKELNCVNQKLKITIKRIVNPYGHPNILAEFIAKQLKNKVSFRKTMKQAIKLAKGAGAKGTKIQIAGRHTGKDRARVDWIRKGRVPLQTIRAKIDYCSYTVKTIHGVFGIKIWLFVDEKKRPLLNLSLRYIH